MIVCNNCGFKCQDGSKFCTKCANKLTGNQGANTQNKRKFITNTNVLLSDGEVNIKSYHVTTFPDIALTRFLSLATDGYVSVTNKRVVFFGDGKKSTLFSEVDIDKITGLSSYFGRGWNLLAVIFWVIFYIVQLSLMLGSFTILKYHFSFAVFMGLIMQIGIFGLSLFIGMIFMRPWMYSFFLTGSGYEVTPVNAGNIGLFSHWWITGQGAANSMMSFFPGPDKEKVTRELGALIKDIQNLGEFGIEKWTNNVANKSINKEELVKTNKVVETNEVVEVNVDNGSDFFA